MVDQCFEWIFKQLMKTGEFVLENTFALKIWFSVFSSIAISNLLHDLITF